MRGSVLTYPLSYLSLKDESGNRLFQRNWFAVLVVVLLLSLPFIFSDANYFGDGGFLDRFGSFAAVLTGFYIAALVGVASFASSVGDLDEVIEVGKITRAVAEPIGDEEPVESLTRRQYVCSMFGYLAFISMFLSVAAILLIVVADPVIVGLDAAFNWYDKEPYSWLPATVGSTTLVGFNLILAHLLVTTCHGLYYLIDRLYAKKPVLLPKRR